MHLCSLKCFAFFCVHFYRHTERMIKENREKGWEVGTERQKRKEGKWERKAENDNQGKLEKNGWKVGEWKKNRKNKRRSDNSPQWRQGKSRKSVCH